MFLRNVHDWYYNKLYLPFYTKVLLKFDGVYTNFVSSKYGLSQPMALPMRDITPDVKSYTWEDWRRDVKKQRPIRYFLLETLPSSIKYNPVSRFLGKIKHWIIQRIILKYYLIDIRNEPNQYKFGWIEHDQALLFSAFKCVENFIEEGYESLLKARTTTEYVALANKEIDFHMNLDDEDLETSMLPSRHVWARALGEIFDCYYYWKFERPAKLDSYFEDHHDGEEKLNAEDNRHLKRIIDVRSFMWV